MKSRDGSGVTEVDFSGAPARSPAGAAPGSIQASAVFVPIVGLTSMDGPKGHAAMSALHRALREALLAPAPGTGIRVLSCLTGAIILVPDDAGLEVAELFAEVAPRIADAGLAMHVGIAHGHVELLEDADGTLNAVGGCLNVAARLAYANANTGVLVHVSYADHIAGILPDDHWLHPAKRSVVEVPGKRTEVFRCFAAPPGAIAIRADCAIAASDPRPAFVNAVLLAYDLPSFSDGDARQLASRFRSVVQEVVRMRATGAIPPEARFSFSPGGDGAVLALAGIHPSRAHDMAEQLERLLEVETSLKAEGAGVKARIGVHYGPVFFYESAEGASRPTGTTLFDADALAGDDEAKKHDGVIVSGALIDLASHGSRAYQRDQFEAIGALPRSHGREISRFVRRAPARSPAPAPTGVSEPSGPLPEHVAIARLPIPGKYLFGRDEELAHLDTCWSDPGTHVVSIVAMGGAGKTALVDRWLKHMQKDSWRGAERVFGWSFYSQGSSNTASGDRFIAEALRWFGDTDPTAGSAWDKGERLARLVRQQRTLLVLDGLEPLQAPPGADEGKIRDPGVTALVRELATGGRGLCVISTRLAVADLAPREDGSAPKIDLDQLSPEDGAKLLEVLGAIGPKAELEDAARDMKGHAIALTLLGSYLTDACAGDIRKRKEVGPLEGDATKGEHAKRVMVAYARWFGEGPEVAVLRLLGLFDRPADAGCIRALRAAPVIRKLTDALVGMSDVHWNQTLAKLRRARLVAQASKVEPQAIDAHPLVREHFGTRLREEAPEAWRDGHGRLFDHLQLVAPEFPGDPIAMAPLYAAVVHGCHAERRQEALDKVLFRRVYRGEEKFNWRKLGAFGPELGMLAAFFDLPWTCVAPGLAESSEAFVLNGAGFALRALGRFHEAAEPLRLGLEKRLAQEKWSNAAMVTRNLSEVHLARGAIPNAVAFARQSVELAHRSKDWHELMDSRATLAAALHQAGSFEEALALFEKAEALQKAWQPEYPLLFSQRGFQYCDLLLGQGQLENVLDRARRTLAWTTADSLSLLAFALDHISVGRAHLLLALRNRTGDLAPARTALDEAVMGLRQAGYQEYLPRGLLARAEMHLAASNFPAAAGNLDEVLSIATRDGMSLHETDAQLGLARLHLARRDHDAARASLAAAKALVERVGYHRRDRDITEIEAALADDPAILEAAGSNHRGDEELARLEAMTKDQLLKSLCNLLPAQFDLVVAKLDIPWQYLSGAQAPLASRAVELVRYTDSQGRLAEVALVVAGVTGAKPANAPATTAVPTPAATVAPTPAPLRTPARPSRTAPVDFTIITALEEERDAVLAKLPGYTKLDRDGTGAHTYYEATLATRRQDGAAYRVVVTSLSGMGPIKGAIKAAAVIQRWSPAHVLMVGIAGGIQGEAELGDVMVASQMADYTVGKVRDGGPREERWMAYPADADLLDAAGNFATGWEDLINHARPEPGKPRRCIGVVASGGNVITSNAQIEIYLADWPKLIGVEMEGGGVAAGLHDDIARPRFLMIRGVSDLANGANNAEMKKRWRTHACHVAAAYAIGLLRDGPVPASGARSL